MVFLWCLRGVSNADSKMLFILFYGVSMLFLDFVYFWLFGEGELRAFWLDV